MVSPEQVNASLGRAGVAAARSRSFKIGQTITAAGYAAVTPTWSRTAVTGGVFAVPIAATVWWARRKRIVARPQRLTRDPNVWPPAFVAVAIGGDALDLRLVIAARRR